MAKFKKKPAKVTEKPVAKPAPKPVAKPSPNLAQTKTVKRDEDERVKATAKKAAPPAPTAHQQQHQPGCTSAWSSVCNCIRR